MSSVIPDVARYVSERENESLSGYYSVNMYCMLVGVSSRTVSQRTMKISTEKFSCKSVFFVQI
jgi:hypothetical protein